MLLGTTTTMQLFSYQGNYPINALRNAALNAITTSHVLVVDVDFFPSTELHEAILAQSLYLKNHPRSALVVPAFQRKGNWRGYSDKRWKRELSKPTSFPKPSPSCSIVWRPWRASCLILRGTATRTEPRTRQIGSRPRPKQRQHAPSAPPTACAPPRPSPRARTLPNCRRVCCRSRLMWNRGASHVSSPRFEPYVVLRNNADVRFDASYTGYGKNKIEQGLSIAARGRISGAAAGFLGPRAATPGPRPNGAGWRRARQPRDGPAL